MAQHNHEALVLQSLCAMPFACTPCRRSKRWPRSLPQDGSHNRDLGASEVLKQKKAFSTSMILRMDTILHHFQSMGNHCLLVFAGESSFQGFFGGVGFRPSAVSWLLLGNILHVCLLRFSGGNPTTELLKFENCCSPSNVKQDIVKTLKVSSFWYGVVVQKIVAHPIGSFRLRGFAVVSLSLRLQRSCRWRSCTCRRWWAHSQAACRVKSAENTDGECRRKKKAPLGVVLFVCPARWLILGDTPLKLEESNHIYIYIYMYL